MVLTFYLKMHCDIFFLWPIHWLIMFLFLNINVLCGFFSVFFHPCPCPCNDDNTSLLLLKAAEGFLFVVSCDRARILYVSESVRNILNYTRVNMNWHKVVNHIYWTPTIMFRVFRLFMETHDCNQPTVYTYSVYRILR